VSTRYNYNKGDYVTLRNMMTIDWSELLQPLDGDPDAQFQLFSKTLEKAVSACVPCYKNKKNITELKWIKLLEN